MELNRVMVVLDKPNRPQTALKRTLRLMRDMPEAASLEAVSFMHNALLDHGAAFDAKERKAIKKMLRDSRNEWLASLSAEHPEIAPVHLVWEERIADWINDHSEKSDLVVKTASGSRRERSASDWALLHNCPTNLLLVGHRRIRQPQVVLAAVDVAHTDRTHLRLNQRVIDAAATMAQLAGAQLHIAAAVEVAPALIDLDIIDERSAQRRIAERSRAALDEMLQDYPVPVKNRHFPVGPIGRAMADCAKSLHADLLVVGTRARPVRSLLGLGNTAQRIVRQAPCDVLAVRP